MAYEALYTRARPKNLAQLVGQEHISNSLARALNQDRLSHAYLLVGTRGTGKTSTARILARAINCDTVHEANENKKILPNDVIPCNECEACRSFKSSPDNIEFDAASNRSVEDVSRLLSTAYLAPLQSRFKTFIIDEVHMLSFEAVNSILKLIEEPPPNVVFFLATTEFNKVPQTIRSRCQILNFKLIPQDVIANHILNLAKDLNFSLEEAAVRKIARLAKGSMRDALTLFDQCYSMTDSDLLTVDIVDNTLGLVSDSDLDEIVEAAKSRDRRQIIESTAKAFKSGLTANIIAESIITRLRDIVSDIKNSRSAELAVYNEMIDQLRKSVIEMQGSGIPEVILETALFKFASNPVSIPVYEMPKDYSFEETYSPPVRESENNPKPNIKDKVVNIKDFKTSKKNQSDAAGDLDDGNYTEEVDPVFAEIDNDYMDSLADSQDEGYSVFSEFDSDSMDSLNESKNQEEAIFEPEISESENFTGSNPDFEEMENQSEDTGEDIFNFILKKLEQNGEIEIFNCLKLAKVVKYKSETFFLEFAGSTVSAMFQGYIEKLELLSEKYLGNYIKFQLFNDENLSNDSFKKNDIFGKMAEPDKEYLFNIMKFFNVDKNDIRLLYND